MNRFSVRWSLAVAVIAVVGMSQLAWAQPEEGRRGRGGRGFGGGFGVTAVRLAAESKEVQAALKLTDEQKEKAAEINDQLRDDVGAVLQGGQGRGEIQKLYKEASAKLDEVLDDDQQKRLSGIAVQINGPNALMEPAVAKELAITDEQNEKMAEVRESNMRAMRDLFTDQSLSREEMRDKFGELRSEANKKLLAVLSSEQQEKLESLKGEPVDVDMSQFRGFGRRGGEGRGRDRERDGERERGDRDREEAASEN